MEEKINIAAILKDKSQVTKLYDWLHNIDIELDTIITTDTETVVCCTNETNNNTTCHRYYSEFGTERGYPDGLQILFPSKEMRDWNKFSWKNGDVLVNEDGDAHVIFEGFDDDTYETFNGNYYLENNVGIVSFVEHEGNFLTSEFDKANKENAKEYISTIEERLGGKLNRDTLEIEKAQPEFKDGDIVTMHKKNCDIVFIFNRLRTEGSFYYYALHTLQTNNTGVIDCNITLPCAWTFFGGKMNFATDSEKQQLFDALAIENKAWNAEKKQIMNLKTNVDELKPFDKVVVRCNKADKWSIDFFSYKVSNGYICTGDAWFGYCLPYNEETAKLIGTTNNVEG